MGQLIRKAAVRALILPLLAVLSLVTLLTACRSSQLPLEHHQILEGIKLANIGRETVLKRNNSVIAGVRVNNISWQSESVDISEGEETGYRELAEIDGVFTLQIDVELITKDYELQEIAYSRSNSRLLENVTLDLASETGFTQIDTNWYLSNISESANYNDALSFSATLISSARIQNGEIIGINSDPLTGEITGTPGYSYNNIIVDLRIKINTINYNITNNGEAYIHGVDELGNDIDQDGWVTFQGENYNIERAQYVNELFDPQWEITLATGETLPQLQLGLIFFDTAKQKPFRIIGFNPFEQFGDVAAGYYDSQTSTWYYDNNDEYIPFIPSSSMCVIGYIVTSFDFIDSATVFSEALPLSDFGSLPTITCTPNYFDNNYWFDDGFVVWDAINNRWGSIGQAGYSIENSFPPDGDPAPWSDQYRPSLLYLTLQNDGNLIQNLQLVVTADTIPFGQGNSQSIHNSFVNLPEGVTSFELSLDWSGLSIDYQIRFVSLFDFINTPVYITCVQFDPP